MAQIIFLLVLAASVLHAIWNFFVRKTSGNIVVLWFGLWIGCLFLAPVVIIRISLLDLTDGPIIMAVVYTIATGLIHAVYFLLLTRAYSLGEISLVYPVARGSGVALTALAAWIVLQENFSIMGVAGIIFICLGIFFISGSAGSKLRNYKPILMAVGIGVTIVAYSIVDKIGVEYVDPPIYIWLMFFLSALFLAPYILTYHHQLIREFSSNWLYATIIGIGSISTYLMILIAFQRGPVGYIVAIREVAVVVGALLGILLLKERVTFLKLLAIGIIIGGSILIRFG